MPNLTPDILEEPNIQLAGLKIWVHGRQFPDARDYDDANWLIVTARCEAEGARVQTTGPIIHLSEISAWLRECESLQKTLSGQAELACMEPELSVLLVAESLGHISMTVCVTPDHLRQRHEFIFDLDQTYLEGLIVACQKLLVTYPVKFINRFDQ